jgi:predicted metal-dependent phosphoesterase TrpH
MSANYKELISKFTKEDYLQNNVNLHIHTTYSDGKGKYRDIVHQAKEKGYKNIAITDHNTIKGHIENPDLLGFVIPAVEFDVWYKYIFLHLIAYGIDTNAACMEKFYAKNKNETEKDIIRIIPKRNIYELIKAIHQAGGIAVIAHPACCWAINMDDFIKDLKNIGLDGIEIYYPYPRWRKYMKFAPLEKLDQIADKYGLIKTGGTDLHNEIL